MIGLGNIIQLAGKGGGGGGDFASITGLPSSNAALNPYLNSITNLENNEFKYLYWASVSSNSGTISIPTNATILLGEINGLNALVETISGGKPTGNSPVTSGGSPVIVSSFNTAGNYVLSGTPSAYPVAVLFVLKIKSKFIQNLNLNNVIAEETQNNFIPSFLYSINTLPANTGSTTNNAIASLLIKANTCNIGSLFGFQAIIKGSQVAANGTIRIYSNTINSLSGAVLLGNWTIPVSTYQALFIRSFYVTSNSQIIISKDPIVSAQSGNYDSLNLYITFNRTIDNYLIITFQNGNVADSQQLLFATLSLQKA